MKTHGIFAIIFVAIGVFYGIARGQSAGIDTLGIAPASSSPGVVSITRPKPAAVIKAKAIWSADAAKPGDQRVLAVVLDIDPRYHVNPAKHLLPTDSFQVPTELKIATPTAGEPPGAGAGVRLGEVQYPAPTKATVRYSGTAVQQDVYHGRAVLYLPVIVNSDAAIGEHALRLTLAYQACDENVCLIPSSVELTASLNVTNDLPATAPPDSAIFGGFDASSFIKLAAGIAATSPANTAPQERTVVPPNGTATASGEVALDFFGYSLSIRADRGAGMAALLALAAVGGLLLNFTPCVLPVLPLKAMSISRAAADRGRCLLLGVAMSIGVVAFWLGLGVLVSFVSGFTAANQLFQYPWFTIAVGIVLAVMAIGMTGLFTIEPPRWVSSVNLKQESLVGSVGMGVMTAVLSTPCTGPFMGGAAAWAVKQPAWVALTTFACIGTGMAIPYLALSAFPALVNRIPRSGPGSELLKQVMGLLMLAAAAYFIGAGISAWMVKPPAAPSRAYWWAVAALIAVAGGWSAVRVMSGEYARMMAGRSRMVAGLAGAALVLFGAAIAVGTTRAGPFEWQGYTPEAFAAAQKQGQVVVLDFTAEWCLNCKVIEATILDSPRVVAALRSDDVVAMKVDITSAANVDGTRKLTEVGRLAIPALVVFAPDGTQTLNSDAYSIKDVVEAVARARDKQ